MLLCWTGVTLVTMWFVSLLPTGCPVVPEPLSDTTEINTATQIQYDLCGPQTLTLIFMTVLL